MNKKVEELKQEMQELNDKVFELQEKIESIEKTDKSSVKRWRAEKGEIYFMVECNEVKKIKEDYSVYDDFFYKTRNYFKTGEQAEKYLEKINMYYDLMDLAEELNGDDEEIWNDTTQKYYIFKDYDCDEIKIDWHYDYKNVGQIYCVNENFLKKAIEKFGKEKLNLLFE